VIATVGDPSKRAARDATVIEESWAAPERFGAIFDAYFAEIHTYVARRIGPDNASDIAAETFLAAFRKRDTERASVRTWLYGFATKLIGKHRRSELRLLHRWAGWRQTPTLRDTRRRSPGGSAPKGYGDASPARSRSRRAGDRDVVLLVTLAQLSHEQVAAALDIPYGTVGSRLNRARRKLRGRWAGRIHCAMKRRTAMDELRRANGGFPAGTMLYWQALVEAGWRDRAPSGATEPPG
jgi:DNA-directed RNA polymerase specialized sigma24 family protein